MQYATCSCFNFITTASPMKTLLFVLAFVSFQAYASGPCDKAITDADLLKCADAEFSAADKKLNDTYSKLLNALDPEGQHKLKESQRAWVKFRDLNAEFAGDSSRGGSAESVIIVDTETQMTEARIKELQRELELR